MSDKGKIIAGLVIFLVLATFPIWYAVGTAGAAAAPDRELPTNAKECVRDTAYMTANHMDLLNQWRDAVVRDGETEYTSPSGATHVMSLTGTCLACHNNTETFCARCHTYADVQLDCWDCHLESKGN